MVLITTGNIVRILINH